MQSVDRAGGNFLGGLGNQAGPRYHEGGAGDAESSQARRRLGGQVHFLGRLGLRLGGYRQVDEGFLRRAVQSPAENDLVQLAEHPGQVGFDKSQDLLPLGVLFVRFVAVLGGVPFHARFDLVQELLAEPLGHVAEEDAAADDVALLEVPEEGQRIGLALGEGLGFVGETGPFPLLLDVLDLRAVLGRQFVDAAFGINGAEEFQEAQCLLEIGHGHEDVGGDVGLAASLDDCSPRASLVDADEPLELGCQGH